MVLNNPIPCLVSYPHTAKHGMTLTSITKWGIYMTLTPIRVTKKQACELLAIGREKLRMLVENDPTFPRPYKTGNKMQSSVYFDYQALIDWHKAQGGNA